MESNFCYMVLRIDSTDPVSVDHAIDTLLSDATIKKRIYERIRYNISSPGFYFFETLDSMIRDGRISSDTTLLFRAISQLENEVSFLSHQLINYDSIITKYDKLAVKVDSLKRQNVRLSTRNKELVHALSRTKNNR